MRPLPAWVAFLAFAAACSTPPSRPRMADDPATHSQLAEDDRFVPPYGKPEISRTLINERGAEATQERIVNELSAKDPGDAATDDKLRGAVADLAVRRRFIESLEACEASGRFCPPRLDDPPWAFEPDSDKPPPIDTVLRFDLGTWQKMTAELHGRACACRTIACVDSLGVAIDQLEARPNRVVQGDDVASLSLTRARECLFRLRGKAARIRPLDL